MFKDYTVKGFDLELLKTGHLISFEIKRYLKQPDLFNGVIVRTTPEKIIVVNAYGDEVEIEAVEVRGFGRSRIQHKNAVTITILGVSGKLTNLMPPTAGPDSHFTPEYQKLRKDMEDPESTRFSDEDEMPEEEVATEIEAEAEPGLLSKGYVPGPSARFSNSSKQE